MEQNLMEVIERFKLTNECTRNSNIWMGHARIGGEGYPSMEEAKKILSEHFGECIADAGQNTPEWIEKSLQQWQDFHPFQNVREKDQPLFVKKLENNKVIVAVIWPWQIKRDIASLMVYEGELVS